MANGQHVLALIGVDDRRTVFDLEAQSAAQSESEEFVRNVDHLVAAAGVRAAGARHNVPVERRTAVLEGRFGFRGAGNQMELFDVGRCVLRWNAFDKVIEEYKMFEYSEYHGMNDNRILIDYSQSTEQR